MRIVLDTSVLVAAVRSAEGASRLLVEQALISTVQLVISAPLVLEYEAVLTRAEHLLASGLTADDVSELLNLVCEAGIEVRQGRRLRPRLVDPDDELVLEAAVNGRAQVIVTFNSGDFAGVREEFEIEVLSPAELLRRIRQ